MPSSQKAEFQIAEYQALRAEMLQQMQTEIQLTSFALIFTSSVIGLVASSARPLAPEILLLPLPVLWFSIYSDIEHHQQVITIGTYIHDFFESQDLGLRWEDRLSRFRAYTKNMVWKPFRFHHLIWFLNTGLAAVCVIPAAIQSFYIAKSISLLIIFAGTAATLIALHTLLLIIGLEKIQPKFANQWKRIYKEEQAKK